MTELEAAHRRWLERGHGYLEKAFLEKIWWPAFGTLEGLHPEFWG